MQAQLGVTHVDDTVVLTLIVPTRVISSDGPKVLPIQHTLHFSREQWETVIFTQAQQLGFNPSIPNPIET